MCIGETPGPETLAQPVPEMSLGAQSPCKQKFREGAHIVGKLMTAKFYSWNTTAGKPKGGLHAPGFGLLAFIDSVTQGVECLLLREEISSRAGFELFSLVDRVSGLLCLRPVWFGFL